MWMACHTWPLRCPGSLLRDLFVPCLRICKDKGCNTPSECSVPAQHKVWCRTGARKRMGASWMSGRKDRQMDGCIGGQVDDRYTDGQADGWMDG